MDEDELDAEDELLAGLDDEVLTIRVDRDGALDVHHGAIAVAVSAIDIDEASIERLRRQPLTVRDSA